VGWILSRLVPLVHLLLAVALARALGWATGVAAYVLLVGLMTAAAGLLLRSLKVDKVTWQNRLASWLLPWAGWVGGGTLGSLLVKNGLTSVILGVLVVWSDQRSPWETWLTVRNGDRVATSDWVSLAVSVLTFSGWVAISSGWLWWIRCLIGRNFVTGFSALKDQGIWWPLWGAPVVLAASYLLRQAGQFWLALGVVAVPLLILLTPVLFMLVVILGHYLTGRPIRWS